MFALELGRKVKDNVTGFSGIITGRVEYLTGCRQYLVMPKALRNNKMPTGEWIDEDRLINKTKKNSGGPQLLNPPVH